MGKYEEFKQLTLPLSVVKKFFTTTGNSGRKAVGASGNEGIILSDWIQERIDDGTINPGSVPSSNTDLTFSQTATTVTVISSTGTDAVIPSASTTLAGVMTADDKIKLESLITLTGLPAGDTTLGIFSGTIIPDNMDIKSALQFLESKLDTIPSITQGDLLSANTVISVTNGTNAVFGSDTTLTFNAGNINLSDIGGTLDVDQISTTGATTNDIIIFNGTNWVVDSIPTPSIAHNDLTGLQGGQSGQYYHLPQSIYDILKTTNANKLLGRVSTIGEVQELTLGGSLVFNGTAIELSGDSATPGNNKYWGTNGSGVKGFYTLSAVGTVTNVSATNSADLTFTITNPTSTPDITAVLTNTGVTSGTYGSNSSVSVFTVNSKGRITSAIDTPIAITSSNVSNFSEAVDDRVNGLLIAGTGITLTYDDTANTLTIDSSAVGSVTGTGVANRVAFWTSATNLSNDSDLGFDGTYLTLGNPGASTAKFTSKGVGGTQSTFGFIHQNSTNADVFKVADNGAVTIGALGEIYLHPDSINLTTGGNFPINVSGGDLTLYSDLTVTAEGGGSASNTPSFKSIATRSTNIGTCINAQIEGSFTMGAGSNSYYDLHVKTIVNQTGGTSAIRSIYVDPTLSAATNYTGVEINAPGHTALKVAAGNIRLELTGTATGDIYYRKADGTVGVLPIGGPMEVLGSTGTIPAWTTTAGSLPGGANGDFLIYSGGSWASGSPIKEKQTGITGVTITLGATPLGSSLFTLYRNGIYQDDTDDYSIVGNVITMVTALVSTDKITAIYYT